jgi:hypothetical protein
MIDKLLLFMRAHLGRWVTSPHGLGGECVDLVELWALALGASALPGNAVDLGALADKAQWTWTSNGPSNAPPAGAIVVWGPWPAGGIGRNGHTGVALVGGAMDLLTLDQNWPAGSSVAVQLHDYGGVQGWLVRR